MKHIFFYCLLLFSTALFGKEINIGNTFVSHKIELSEIFILEDTSNQYNPANWSELVRDSGLYKLYDKNIRINRSTWWAKLTINNQSNIRVKLYLYTDYTPLEYVYLYQLDFNNQLLVDSAGCKIPFNTRKASSNLLAFEVDCKPGLNLLFLKAQSPYVKFPFILGTRGELIRAEQNQTMYYSWVVGIFLVIALGTLASFIYFKDNLFLKYFVYLMMLLMLVVTYVGYGFQYLWPYWEKWNSKSYMFFGILMAATHLLFAVELLKIERYSFLLKKVITGIAIMFMVISCTVVFLDSTIALYITLPTISSILPITAILIYYPLKDKSPLIYSYLAGFAVFLLPTTLTLFKDMGVLFFNDGMNVHIFTGMVIEAIFFTIALGLRIKENLEKMNVHCELNNKCISKDEFVVLDMLTKKENEIFNYVGLLLNDIEIAEKSGVSMHTVRYHIRNIYEKLELKNRIMLIQKYEEVKKMQRVESKVEG